MSKTYEGGCHCGAVRYTVTKAPELTFYCHCNDCQRTSGSPYSMELMVERDAVQFNGALSSYVVVGDSGSPVTRFFCPKCSSGMYLDCDADPDYLFLKVGSLDDASWVTPQMHIFTSAKQPWVQIDDGLPQYEKMPDE